MMQKLIFWIQTEFVTDPVGTTMAAVAIIFFVACICGVIAFALTKDEAYDTDRN